MKLIVDKSYSEERALYNSHNIKLVEVKFDGEEDGESALKECKKIILDSCYLNLRYPLWHNNKVSISNTTMTANCRAALWYSSNIKINDSSLLGIKCLRECKKISIANTLINSPEFGWKNSRILGKNLQISSEYLFFESKNISLFNIYFKGKYSFQYTKNVYIEGSNLDTKDAFWHSENVTVKNSTIRGEYLGWYSKNLTFINCTIIGTQPLCYCKKLTLINCRMIDTDLSFEYSDVYATINGTIESVKNPKKGFINAKQINKLIYENSKYRSKCSIFANVIETIE